MFAHRTKPLLPRKVFVVRVLLRLALSPGIIGASLVLGIFGGHFCAELPGLDALLHASMFVTGMGPVKELHSVGAKFFTSFYALFSGVVFLTAVAVFLAPVLPRFLPKSQLEAGRQDDDDRKEPLREATRKAGEPDRVSSPDGSAVKSGRA